MVFAPDQARMRHLPADWHDLRFSIQNDVRFQFDDTRMKFRSRTRISFGMKTGMNSFRNKSHFRYHANSPLSFVELIIDAFDDASIVLIFFLMIFIMFAEITFVCVYSEDGTIVSFRLDKCFVFWQISGILTRSIPVNWPFWSCRGWSGRHLFPSAKLTFSSQWLSQDISLFLNFSVA